MEICTLLENIMYLSVCKCTSSPLFDLRSCAASFKRLWVWSWCSMQIYFTSGWELILTGKLGAGLVEWFWHHTLEWKIFTGCNTVWLGLLKGRQQLAGRQLVQESPGLLSERPGGCYCTWRGGSIRESCVFSWELRGMTAMQAKVEKEHYHWALPSKTPDAEKEGAKWRRKTSKVLKNEASPTP